MQATAHRKNNFIFTYHRLGWELTIASQKLDLEVKWVVLQNCHVKNSQTKILRIENKIKTIIITIYKSIVHLNF